MNISRDTIFSEALEKLKKDREQKIASIVERRKPAIKRLQNFWADCLVNHPYVGNLLDDDDMEVFGYLSDFRVEKETEADITTQKLIFDFQLNPYFKNTRLVKVYKFEGLKPTAVTFEKVQWKVRDLTYLKSRL